MTSTANLQNFEHPTLEFDLNKILFAPNNKGEIVYEIWKDIPEYENYYQVSNFGRVKSLDRKIKHIGNSFRIIKGRIRKQIICTDGYFFTSFKGRDKKFSKKTHKLVAIAFLNHKPCGFKIVVDHKDNVCTNNYIWNLQLITHRLNCSKDKKGYSSRYVGVSKSKDSKKYRSTIHKDKKVIHLGMFDKEFDAHIAYQKKLKEL